MPDTPFIRASNLRPWIGAVPLTAIEIIFVNGKSFYATVAQFLQNFVPNGQYVTVNINYQSVAGDRIFVDTSAGPIVVSLPSTPSPVVGDTIGFIDKNGTWGTNNLTVAGNGQPIVGLLEDMVVDISRGAFSLSYSGTDWRFEE